MITQINADFAIRVNLYSLRYPRAVYGMLCTIFIANSNNRLIFQNTTLLFAGTSKSNHNTYNANLIREIFLIR